MNAMTALTTPRRRGRPPIKFDNHRVQGFVNIFRSAHELCENHPPIDDVFEGVAHLQTIGEAHTRPLSRRTLFRVLQGCDVIDTASVARVLAGTRKSGDSASTVGRYAAAARVSARAITRLLDANPRWELALDRHEVDAPYLAELRDLGLA